MTAPHHCNNCEGVDPDSCLANDQRPMTDPDIVTEARRLADRLATQRHYECGDCWYSCPESDEGCCNDTVEGCTCTAPLHHEAARLVTDLVAELRRLRHTVATITDAIGEHRDAPNSMRFRGYVSGARYSVADLRLYKAADIEADAGALAAAVEALDGEGRDPRPATCPTCGSKSNLFAYFGCPDPWHGEGR